MNEKKAFDEIIKTFDFRKVRSVMTALAWYWMGDTAPPTIEKMKEHAREQFDRLQESQEYLSTSSGGFALTREEDDGEKLLTLTFTLESASEYVS